MTQAAQHAPLMILCDPSPSMNRLIEIMPAQQPVICVQTLADAQAQWSRQIVLLIVSQSKLAPADLPSPQSPEVPALWVLVALPSAQPTTAPLLAHYLPYARLDADWTPEELANVLTHALAHYELTQSYTQFIATLAQPLEQATPAASGRPFETSEHTSSDAGGQFVHAGKMALLGQMVAGIAHEINTPAGAIQAAIGNMRHHLKCLLDSVADLTQQGLTRADLAQILPLVARMLDAIEQIPRKSPADIRVAQKPLVEILQPHYGQHSRRIAKEIARMNLGDQVETLLTLSAKYASDEVLTCLIHCNRLIHSTQDIHLSIGLLIRIIQALKSYAYPWQDTPELANIHDSLETALTLLKNKMKQRIHVDYPPSDLPAIWCYPGDLMHVWMNLLYNATQAIPQTGTIRIETLAADDYLSVKISDTGTGIAPEHLPYLFEPHFTTKRRGEGTGLGLYLARQIVTRHHGVIIVTSAPGHTTFEVRLARNLPAHATRADTGVPSQ